MRDTPTLLSDIACLLGRDALAVSLIMPDSTRDVLRVFLAWPSDLETERRTARAVVQELNIRVAAELGFYVELWGWEDQPPGAGRPQALINPRVDECDIFVGMLWKRWGQPSGECASGFLEEFERARERNRQDGTPEIWLAFKVVDADRQDDAGPQLRQVLEFKETQIAAREFLFREFKNDIDFERQFRSWITDHIVKLHKLRLARPSLELSQPQSPGGTQHSPSDVGVPGEPDRAIPTELTRAADRIAATLRRRDVGNYFDAGVSLDRIDLVRMQLHIQSWAWFLYGGPGIGVHEINFLYQSRDAVELIVPEDLLVLSMLAGDPHDVVPGWSWFTDYSREESVTRMVLAIMQENEAASRARAVHRLEISDAVLDAQQFVDLITATPRDDSAVVGKAVLSYIAASGDKAHLSLFDRAEFADRPELRSDVVAARVRLLLKVDAAGAVDELMSAGSDVGDRVAEVLEGRADALPISSLENMLRHGSGAIRLVALSSLARRGEPAEEILRGFMSDSSYKVRALACSALVTRGATIEPKEIAGCLESPPGGLFSTAQPAEADAVVVAAMRRSPRARLEAQIAWLNLDGPLAYEALGLEYFELVRASVRGDLSDDFRSLERDWQKKPLDEISRRLPELTDAQRQTLEEMAQRTLETVTPKVSDFIRSKYIQAALNVLAKHGVPEDVEFARKHLKLKVASVQQGGAIRLIGRFGDVSDVASLIEVAKASYGAERAEAIKAALALAPGLEGVAVTLLSEADTDFVPPALRALRDASSAQVLPVVEPLLSNEREDVRVLATAFLVGVMTVKELEAVLIRYRRAGFYYYNVGCWLDRVLYAPAPFREAFTKQLVAKLGSPAPN